MSETQGYAELHAHSNFSFLDGAAHPEELAAVAVARGLSALAITDHGGLYAMVRFTAAANRLGLRAIIGAELTVEAMPGIETPEPHLLVDPLATTKPRERQRGRHHLTVLARDGTGFSNLTRMLSHSNLGAPPSDRKGYTAVAWELLTEHTDGLVVLSGCKRMGLIPRLLRGGRREAAAEAAARLRELFDADGAGNFFLELQNHMVPEDPWTCAETCELGRDTGIACVASNDVHMMTPQDKPLQDMLVAIRERGTLDEMEAQGFLAPNAERYVKTRAEMEEALLAPATSTEPWLRRAYMEALDRSVEIAGRCDFELDLRSKRFPGFPVPDGETPFSYLYQLCQQGVKSRYKPMTSTVARRLQTELEVIEKTGLAEFFLINWDLMRFAKDNGIPG
ncbi:MAG: PHP domain-containing protein, partial [Candidatus Dormibacteraeota bacterium]|nr:PHP domain-containing protein [Candidatus Dormibacteraeota bacterium]